MLSGAKRKNSFFSILFAFRIAQFAFDYAVRTGRKKVTAVHKANIMKLGDGLFLETCEAVSKMYPQVRHNPKRRLASFTSR